MIFLLVFGGLLSTCAAQLLGTPTVTSGDGLITPPAELRFARDLHIRASSSGPVANNVCGYSMASNGSRFTLFCANSDLYCEPTILPNGKGFQYCSAFGSTSQGYWTTGYSYGKYSSCPSSAFCCPSSLPGVLENLIVGSGFTLTQFDCTTPGGKVYTHIYTPAQRLLNAASSTSSSSSSSIPSTSSSTPTKTTASTSTSSSAAPNSGGGGGLSSDAKIGIGVGVGIGAALILAAAAAYFFWTKHNKKKGDVKEIAYAKVEPTPPATQYRPDPQNGMGNGYGQPMPYSQPQYHHHSMSSQWSSQPYQPLQHDPTATGYLVEPQVQEMHQPGYMSGP